MGNVNTVVKFLGTKTLPPSSRPGAWAYPGTSPLLACIFVLVLVRALIDYSTYEKGKSELMFGLVSSPGSGSKLRLDVSVNIITHNESFLWKKFTESQENILWGFG